MVGIAEPKDQGPRKDEIPNIVGQTVTNADSQIVSAGFDVGSKSTTSTDNSGLLDTVQSQVDTAGDIKPLSHNMNYTYYSPFFPPFFPPHFPPHFPPFFPPHFPPFFPPFFPPHFPPHFLLPQLCIGERGRDGRVMIRRCCCC